jgi:hypothetical protein
VTEKGLLHQLLFFGPLLLVGFAAGAVRVLASRGGAPERQRRLLQVLWVVLLLAGVPFWLFLAATLSL